MMDDAETDRVATAMGRWCFRVEGHGEPDGLLLTCGRLSSGAAAPVTLALSYADAAHLLAKLSGALHAELRSRALREHPILGKILKDLNWDG